MHFHVLPVGPGRQHSPHQLVMVTTPVIILVIPDDRHKAEIAPVFMPLLRQRPQVHVLVLAHAPEQGHGVAVPGFLKEFHQAFHLGKAGSGRHQQQRLVRRRSQAGLAIGQFHRYILAGGERINHLAGRNPVRGSLDVQFDMLGGGAAGDGEITGIFPRQDDRKILTGMEGHIAAPRQLQLNPEHIVTDRAYINYFGCILTGRMVRSCHNGRYLQFQVGQGKRPAHHQPITHR